MMRLNQFTLLISLGLKSDKLLEEKELESLLLDHLQEFIRELGYGFCFEYRQKRLLFDDEYFFGVTWFFTTAF